MHGRGTELSGVQPVHEPGERLEGVVDCHHPFGIGVQIGDDDFGHVNTPEVFVAPPLITEATFPVVGSRVSVRVLGYSPTHQLRLSMRG